MTAGFDHHSVLLEECVQALSLSPGARVADVTAGGGGHSAALLSAVGKEGRLVCIDRDMHAVVHLRQRFASCGDRVLVIHGEFSELPRLLDEYELGTLDGLVADLGVSSPQLDDPERGFSFRHDGPLDMRMNKEDRETALEIIARCDERSLADLLYKYGEERQSRPIARSILRALEEGGLRSTADLRRAVVRVTGPRRRGLADPATRTFQALRLVVNGELRQLQALLGSLPDVLADRGGAVVISFHSLEDRLVKHAFRTEPRLRPLYKRPVMATDDEIQRNPRARSAKLRAARRVSRLEEEVP